MKTHSFPSFMARWIAALMLLSAVALHALDQSDNVLDDVFHQFASLNGNPEFLGARMNTDGARVSGVPTATHYQGIARSNGHGVPHLFVTRSGDPAKLLVVRLSSRDEDGERLRSNRLAHDSQTRSTPPPDGDELIASISFEYNHAGGIQLAGDVLAVPLEDPRRSTLPEGKVVFFDVSNPANPLLLSYELRLSHKAGVAGLVRLADDHFLLAVTWGEGDRIKFFRSNKTDFEAPGFAFELHKEWTASELLRVDEGWPTGKTSFQGLSLVRQADGRIFMLGGRNTSELTPAVSGDDLLSIFRIDGWQEGRGLLVLDLSGPPKRFNCQDESLFGFDLSASINADFLAGVGTYISPTGELLLYACEHYAWGPSLSMRFVEFKDRNVYRPNSPFYRPTAHVEIPTNVKEGERHVMKAYLKESLSGPWIELYDHDGFRGRRLIIDYADRNKDDYFDFKKLDGIPGEGFNDKASSVRYYAPVGWTIRLYDSDRFENDEPVLNLVGGGVVIEIPNLSASPYHFDNLDGVHETRVTSVKFIRPDEGSSSGVTWILTEPEPNTARIELGPPILDTPEFTFYSSSVKTLNALNGTRIVKVLVNMTTGAGTPLLITREVKIQNVAPEIQDLQVVPDSPRGNMTLKFFGRDASTFDRHTVNIDWGDGSTTTPTPALSNRAYLIPHRFIASSPLTAEDVFPIHVELNDGESTVRGVLEYRVAWLSNVAPYAGADDGFRQPNHTFKTRLATLLRNDVDPDGDPVAFDRILSSFPTGSVAFVEGAWVIYRPPAGHETAPVDGLLGGFTYSVKDPSGATGSAQVTLRLPNPAPAQNLASISPIPGGSGIQLEFIGIPNRSYQVLCSTDLSHWTPLGTAASGPTGAFLMLDPTAAGSPSKFYRSQLME